MRIVTVLILLSFLPHHIFSQNAIIKGKVRDKKSGETLVGATIMLKGTTKGTITDFNGNYELNNVAPGNHTLVCSFISYDSQEAEINISQNETIIKDFVLQSALVDLDEVKVVTKKNRESENLLLMEQKNASVAVETIGARELSNKGASDAADAATKITGITKQEGAKTLNVRGLGDRYNTTLLNGLPLPSNNAETKNIDLELFSTDIIEYISVEKTFSAPLYGDFGGANITVNSKKFTGTPFLKLGIKSGFNNTVFNTNQFYLQDGPGFFGFSDFEPTPSLEKYDFETNWNPVPENIAPNLGFTMSGGKTFSLSGSKLNVFFTLSYDNEYSYSDLIQNRISGSDLPRKTLEGELFSFETQTTGMININWDKGNNQYYYNSMLLNSSDQELNNLRGFIKDLAETGALVRRSDFERTTVLSNQFLGEHSIKDNTDWHWGISHNYVLNIIPDRRHITLANIHNGIVDEDYKHFTNDNESDYFRYFHDFVENEFAGNIKLEKRFGNLDDNNYKGKLIFGYSGKYKERNFQATQFNHDIYHEGRKDSFFTNQDYYWVYVDVHDIDAFLNDENLKNEEFYIKTFFGNRIRPQTYDGIQMVNAGFTALEYNISSNLLAVAGLRLEHVYQEVDYLTSEDPDGGQGDFTEFKILPSISFKYTPVVNHNFRLALGKTYTLPQFTEMALFLFEGITETAVGNPYITPSQVYNADLKWEWYMKPGELISVSGFGKYIKDPMNKFVMASASNDFSYANTGDWAYLYGLEIDMKKNLFYKRTDDGGEKVFLSANMTLMKTKQELDGLKVREQTNGLINVNFNTGTDELQGAAPLIANANIGYKHDWNENKNSLLTSLVYNYVSDRIYLIGTSKFGNQVDKSVNTIDFILKSNFNRLGLSLSAKNLLNEDIDRVQENESQDFLVKKYNRGIKVSVGVSYTF